MMRLTAHYADIWPAALPATGGTTEGVRELSERFDRVCEVVGREPGTVKKMAEAVVQMPGGPEPVLWEGHYVRGSAQEISDELMRYREPGADLLMIWVEPNSIDGFAWLAPISVR
jgi:hypothetical protein